MIEKEDYVEPRCVLCEIDKDKKIPTSRIIEKLDEYLQKEDYVGARRHLDYWQGEADMLGDERGKLTVLNELVGISRKTDNETDCLKYSDEILKILDSGKYIGNIVEGTSYLNVATGYNAFNRPEKAIEFYKKAEEIYLKTLKENDDRFGGLYNNLALAYMNKKDYKTGAEYFRKAIEVMEKNEDSEPFLAITYSNLADLTYLENGETKTAQVDEYLFCSVEYLRNCKKKNGAFSYACKKCAFVFGNYGYNLIEKELNEYAEKV